MSISGPRKRPSSFTSVPQLRSRHQALLSCRHERQGGFKSLVTPERSADGFFEPADYGVGANSAPPRSRRGGGACAETGVEGNVPTTTRDVGRGRRRGGDIPGPVKVEAGTAEIGGKRGGTAQWRWRGGGTTCTISTMGITIIITITTITTITTTTTTTTITTTSMGIPRTIGAGASITALPPLPDRGEISTLPPFSCVGRYGDVPRCHTNSPRRIDVVCLFDFRLFTRDALFLFA